jgi:hypothetical protein
MSKEIKLVKIVKRLVKRLGMPKWLHRYGPKKYEFREHLQALLYGFYAHLSYRRLVYTMALFGLKCPSKSALQYTAKKLGSGLWMRILKVTSGISYLVALDSTGFSRTNPSYHYLRRIDGGMPKIPVKLSAAFDTSKKKFCAAKIRVLPAHDIRDAQYLLQHAQPKIAVADKGYNSEKLYRFAEEQNMLLMVPKKKNIKKGYARRKMHKNFRIRTYHRRELIEAGFGSIKRKFGMSVSAKTVRTIRTEIYGRLACHNLFSFWFSGLLGQSPFGETLRHA